MQVVGVEPAGTTVIRLGLPGAIKPGQASRGDDRRTPTPGPGTQMIGRFGRRPGQVAATVGGLGLAERRRVEFERETPDQRDDGQQAGQGGGPAPPSVAVPNLSPVHFVAR